MAIEQFELPLEKLRWRCNPEQFAFETTDDLKAEPFILGQDRALNAIQMGLEMTCKGYNIFLTGAAGTGRKTTIHQLIEQIKDQHAVPVDKLYLSNFRDPDQPFALSLPAGQGRKLQKLLDWFISDLEQSVPAVFESENYSERRQIIIDHFGRRESEVLAEFETRVRERGFALVQIQMGTFTRPDLVPVIDDKPLAFPAIEKMVAENKMSEEDFEKLKSIYTDLSKELNKIFTQVRKIQQSLKQRLQELDGEVVAPVVGHTIDEIKDEFKSQALSEYLDTMKTHILENIELFRASSTEEENPAPARTGGEYGASADPYWLYRVNVLVDNSELKGAPVIFEMSPTYKNLFGAIERSMDINGRWYTDFTKIKAGSILRANGGFLILNADDVLLEAGVWPALKRTLKNNQVEILSYDPYFFFGTSALKPQPIEVNLKVIMIGDSGTYRFLYNADDEFKKIFKIKADFDSVMELDNTTINHYSNFIKRICDDNHLKAFDRSAVADIIEHAVILAGQQNKVATRFSTIADLVREADYWAGKEKASVVSAAHVDRAIEAQKQRVNLIESKVLERINVGSVFIDVSGSVVGQVNGLSILDYGDFEFGCPARVTAQLSLGSTGIINIEREANLSGNIHNKAVQIISGFFRGRFAMDKPLSIHATICFEQSYSGVEGDSASSTEIYALLSRIANLSIRQDIAVTGSVNQNGDIQPIGGVNEKIAGFYKVCKARKLTGQQGVMIPEQNVKDLMLDKEILQAVADKKFHIYAIKTINQGIEILTGAPAGERDASGNFPENTVNYLVDQKLYQMALDLKNFDRKEKSESTEGNDSKKEPTGTDGAQD